MGDVFEKLKQGTQEEEEEVSEEQEAVVIRPSKPAAFPNITIHAPKDLWPLGSVELHGNLMTGHTLAAVVDFVDQAQEVWNELREAFAEKLKESDFITAKQITFVRQLAEEAGEKVPDNIAELSKADADIAIKKLKALTNQGGRPSRGDGSRTSRRDDRRQSNTQQRFSRRSAPRELEGEITDAQIDGIRRREGQLGELRSSRAELESWSKQKASVYIGKLDADLED